MNCLGVAEQRPTRGGEGVFKRKDLGRFVFLFPTHFALCIIPKLSPL
jgi:hypothetical protein